MLKRRLLPLLLLAIAFALPAAPQQPGKANAQAERQAQASAPQSAGTENAAKNEEGGKEANPNDVFRHSDSVKLVSRITGLSLDAAYWVCVVLNFIVVFAILWVLLRKALPTVFRNRSEAIQRRLEEARKASEEARVRLTAVEERLSRLDVEIEQMRREAESGAHADEERVMAAAEEERRRIVESAQQEISRAASAARRELKAYVAELAVDLAGKQIRLTESTDEKLVRHFAARLGKDGN
ncbi:MAG TPA: ATP synthase F0 subunit B [Candidatus Angelobacter sp.]